MRNIAKYIEDIVQERNEVIARLAVAQNVDLSLSDWDSFIPDRLTQTYALADMSDMAIDLLETFNDLSLPEMFHYCNERHKLSEQYSGISKTDVLRLLGLVQNDPDIDVVFNGPDYV